MTQEFEVRGAQTDDCAAVQRCAEEAYAPYIAAIGRKPAPMVADFVRLIDAGVMHVAVGPGEKVLGFIVFFAEGSHMLLENVAVCKNAAGQGVGKALIGLCEAQARQAGMSLVRLYTNEKMVDNLQIYPHLGYHETGRRHEDGFNRVYFEKRL